jgi:hypothetical protein
MKPLVAAWGWAGGLFAALLAGLSIYWFVM